MIIEFDPEKDEANRLKHGISMAVAQQLDLDRATIIEDRRFDYGERRYIAFGRLGNRLHCLWFTWRGANLRVIGLRKANERERKRYDRIY